MANPKIGTLGKGTSLIVGTQTIYTCPVGRGAKGRIMFKGQNAAVGNLQLEVMAAGLSMFKTGNIAVNNYVFSIDGAGIWSTGTVVNNPDGTTAATAVYPARGILFLSVGETIQAIITGNAFASFQMNFMGVEVDV